MAVSTFTLLPFQDLGTSYLLHSKVIKGGNLPFKFFIEKEH